METQANGSGPSTDDNEHASIAAPNDTTSPLDVGTDEMQEAEKKPRRWLNDRCDGNEMVMNPNSRPCAPCFFAPILLKCFPDIMEQNCVMEFLGKTGLFKPTNIRARKTIMILALLSTILGWAFLIFADFAISTKYDLIDAAAFNIGSISINNCRGGFSCGDNSLDATRYSLGLKAIAFTRYISSDLDEVSYLDAVTEQIVTTFDDFCDGDRGFAFVAPEACQKCEDASSAMVISILMSTITYFFTFTTDVLRIWPNYDVNCQKVFGGFFAIFSAIMGVQTWVIFRNQCFQSFRKGGFCFNTSMEEIDCETGEDFFAFVYFHWQVGPGLIALGIATFAKVFDLLCNIAIPTPTITRNKEEQWEYERIAEAKDEEVEKEEMERGDTRDDDGDFGEEDVPEQAGVAVKTKSSGYVASIRTTGKESAVEA